MFWCTALIEFRTIRSFLVLRDALLMLSGILHCGKCFTLNKLYQIYDFLSSADR